MNTQIKYKHQKNPLIIIKVMQPVKHKNSNIIELLKQCKKIGKDTT